jgi:hypothetical protein
MAVLVANPLFVHHGVVARRANIIIPGLAPRQRRCALNGVVTGIALDPEAKRLEAAQLDNARPCQQRSRPRCWVVIAGAQRLRIAIIGLVEKWQQRVCAAPPLIHTLVAEPPVPFIT